MNYKTLLQQLESLIQDVPHPLSNFANAASLLYNSLPDINWAGFYFVKDNRLILGPFGGNPACIEIPYGKGVCGTSFMNNETLLIDDVHTFKGHIPCDSASNSEIVIPLRKNGKVIGVMDIDSPLFHRFTKEDAMYLEQFAEILEKSLIE